MKNGYVPTAICANTNHNPNERNQIGKPGYKPKNPDEPGFLV